LLKRLFDIIFSGLALISLSLVILFLYLLINKKLGSPALFRQKRPGLNGNIFEMVKFRSMMDATDQYGKTLPDHKRLTTFGQKLRATSLDELPGLWNVFKGDMSLVGPRPLLVEYLPLYSEEQARRHDVKPGITGWAQINGRNAISWQKKFEYDVWYVKNQSFGLDLKILFLTVKKVLSRADINAQDHITMTAFKGNNNDNPR